MARPALPPATVRKVLELRTKNNWSGGRIWKELQGTKWQVSKTKIQDIIREAAADPDSDVEPLTQNEGLAAATLAASQVAANLRASTQEVLTRLALKTALKAEALVDGMGPDIDAHDAKQLAGAVGGLAGFALKYTEATKTTAGGDESDSALDAFEDAMFASEPEGDAA